jgi:hypothetical protein
LAGAVVDAAVAGFRDLPLETQLEIVGHGAGLVDQLAAAAHAGEGAVLNFPVSVLFPAGEGPAVGEGDETEAAFLGVERRGAQGKQGGERERVGEGEGEERAAGVHAAVGVRPLFLRASATRGAREI